MKKLLILSFFALFSIISSLSAQNLDFEAPAPHPRLIISRGDLTAMSELRATSASARQAHDRLIAQAEQIISAAVVEPTVSGDRLVQGGELLGRLFCLSYAYLSTEDMRYSQRAEREMLAVSGWEDWNPTSVSDIAQITMALAVGYDWLYRSLPVHSRSIIGTAIYEKGLREIESRSIENPMQAVGVLYGALATLERAPEFCRELAQRCAAEGEKMLDSYAADGAFTDEFARWTKSIDAVVLYSAALQSALGQKSVATSHKGFMQTAMIMNNLVAPSGKNFNFYGLDTKAVANPAKYWFARELGDPSIVAVDDRLAVEGALREDYMLPLYLVFASALDAPKSSKKHSDRWINTGQMPIYVYRGGWERGDSYFAIKGGASSSQSEQADAGAFVYERDGVRWATLDGGYPYNTITFDGEYLSESGLSTLREVTVSSRRHGVVADLTAKYAKRATRVERTAIIDKNDYLTITDHVECGNQATVIEWAIATNAEAEIVAPNTILLRKGGKSTYLRIKTRLMADAKLWDEKDGTRRVGFIMNMRAGSTADIEVSFAGERVKGVSLPKINILRKRK